ncbi:uncharacterized protein LOC126676595 [Mercurialis annua]|uniref:uncharacterized protein LOC126676595 n=1 Tax=Mercurialis annua TaxID=3986 RepID=UPI00215E4CEC|nr:uncharacterized protein LOC126676595 [Mercurialis annua]
MKTLYWNCQGLGTTLTRKHLKWLVKSQTPDVLCLAETKNQSSSILQFVAQLGYDNLFVIEPIGTSGGFLLFWTSNVQLHIQSYSSYMIVCTVNQLHSAQFDVVFCHLHSSPGLLSQQLDVILGFQHHMLPSSVLLGDFNAILHPSEKEGGTPYLSPSYTLFSNFVVRMSLKDMGYIGFPFTWSNKRNFPYLIRERLDRALVYSTWFDSYSTASLQHLTPVGSDHAPIILNTHSFTPCTYRHFHFDQRWGSVEEVSDIIRSSWKLNITGTLMFQVFEKLKVVRRCLNDWRLTSNTNSQRKIISLRHESQLANSQVQTNIQWPYIKSLEAQLVQAQVQEEAYWAQKSRISWLTWGDKNSSFFHSKTKQHRCRNMIYALQDSAGQWHTKDSELVSLITKYFEELYQTSYPANIDQSFSNLC